MAEKDALQEALSELDTLEKSLSEEKTETEVDELEKSVKEVEELAKSLDKDADDKEGDKDKEEDKEEDEDGKPEDMEKSIAVDAETMEELIKTSEAYASLEKSVKDSFDGIGSEIGGMKKAIAGLINLNVSQAKVIGSLTKSIQKMGAVPVATNKTSLGVGAEATEEKPLQKSKAEVQDLLEKALRDGKQFKPSVLSRFASKPGLDGLFPEEKEMLGL